MNGSKARTELLAAMQRSLPGVKRAVEAPPKTLWNNYDRGYMDGCHTKFVGMRNRMYWHWHKQFFASAFWLGFTSCVGVLFWAAVVWKLIH